MQQTTRRRAIIRNGVMAGSVWETRMKMDEVKGGIKVFNAAGESGDDEEGLRVYRRLRRNQSDGIDGEKKKRKSWKQPETQRSPIQLRKARSIEIGCKRGVEEKGVLLICDGKGNEREMAEEEEEEEEIDVEVEEHRRSFDDKEMDLPVEKEKKIEEINEILVSPPPPTEVVDKKTFYVVDLKENGADPEALSQGEEEEADDDEILFKNSSGNSNRMQHIVDLVMWRDISKTAFAFGFGTFFLVSSSYAKDLNFSLISVISYLGLLYLGIIFILRSILWRGEEGSEFHEGDGSHLLGEDEAIWIARRILPYINELILRTKALFSGDPATTMKMAVFLFVMGRCGNSVTVWTLARLAFFGAFTVPKALSSYSPQLGRYGKFWLKRFQDGWESCTHKKAVVAAIFTLIWNLSSTIARIWSVFMLVVAIRLYQQCVATKWNEEDLPIEHSQQHQHHHEQQQQKL